MGRSEFERKLEDVLSAAVLGAQKGESFCVTYKLARKDHDAAWKAAVPMLIGYKAEIMSILRFDASEASDVAETLDIGVLDGDEDAYVDGAVVPIFAIGSSDRVAPIAGVAGYTAIPGTGAALVVTGTSAGTVGITSYAITIRFYK